MKTCFFLATISILTAFYASLSFILAFIGLVTTFLIVLLAIVHLRYFVELMSTDHRPPVVGPITILPIHFHELYDYMASLARKYPTFRFVTPTHSEVCTADPVNVEYILKTNFANYTKIHRCMDLHSMSTLCFFLEHTFILTEFYASPSFILSFIGLVTSFLIVLLAIVHLRYFIELISNDHRPPVVGPITILFVHFHEIYDYLASLAKRYPSFRFVTPTHSQVFTADPVNVEYILTTNFVNYTKGKYNIGILKDLLGDGIFAVDGEKWRHQRKLASLEFSTKVLRDFSTAIFKSCTVKLAERISLLVAAETTIDLQDLLLKSTLDSIFKVAFGFDLDTLSGLNEENNRFMEALDDSNELVYRRFADLLWKVKRYLNIGQEATLKENLKIIDKFVYELIRKKRDQMRDGNLYRDREDILSRFLMGSENDPVRDKYLRDISVGFVFAGKDTTANTLTWFFYMLCKHPLIQEKVREEVKTATEADKNTSIHEFGFRLTIIALDKMHYLHAALSETLRLYPAVPLDGKSAEKDDILPDGFKIKKGDGVAYMAYPMGRMTYIWGEDADDFRPERWLDNGVFHPESPFKFTAFQGGPRICLGKEFAYRQMKILAAFLVYFFKFKLVDESFEAMYRTMFTLHMDKGLDVYAYPR